MRTNDNVIYNATENPPPKVKKKHTHKEAMFCTKSKNLNRYFIQKHIKLKSQEQYK